VVREHVFRYEAPGRYDAVVNMGVTEHLPSVAGPLLEREVRILTDVVESPSRPLVVVLGGAKVRDKIGLIDRFLDTADVLLIGGPSGVKTLR